MFDRAQSTIANVDPELLAGDPAGKPAPGRAHRADRLRELHEPGRDGRAGLAADQQVRRRLPRQALLRRLRIRRRRRATGDRPRQGAVRRRGRQRAAELGLAGQPGRVLRDAQAGRHHHGHEPGPRRPPHARLAGEHVGQVVQRRELRPERRRGHRLRRGREAGAGAQAEADRRGRLGVRAEDRLRAPRRRSPRRWAPT